MLTAYGSDMTPIELSAYPGRFKVRQKGVGAAVFSSRVVTSMRLERSAPIAWKPVTRHQKMGGMETQTIHLPTPMARRMAEFALANLVRGGEERYNCYDFANALNGWSSTQRVRVAPESDKTSPEAVQNGATYWIKSPSVERVTGDPFSHALVGTGPDSTLNVAGPSQNGMGEIVLADASELMRVFGGVALLGVDCMPQ